MEIKLSKKGNRNQLTCIRKDGSMVQSNLGPNIPYHDLAHYVAEKNLGLSEGFFGNVQYGYSIEQLSDKKIIKKLGKETLVAEMCARTLQLLSSGACTRDEFPEIIKQEMELFGIQIPLDISRENIRKMLNQYDKLVEAWNNLPDGETMELEF